MSSWGNKHMLILPGSMVGGGWYSKAHIGAHVGPGKSQGVLGHPIKGIPFQVMK